MRGTAQEGGTRRDLLLSPALASCVALLVLNDHVFKARWPGVVTGKLSDLAGVAMVAIALAALSGRPRGAIVATAAAFTLLKTVGSVAVVASPVLGGVTRTDATDLVALVVLVPVWRWLVGRPPGDARLVSSWVVPLKVVSLCGVALATSATSCATDEVYRVDTVDGVVVAMADDGTFASRDGGRTWQPADDVSFDVADGELGRSACLADGSCFGLTADSVVRTADGGTTTEFRVSADERERLSDADSTKCGLNLFGSITSVELEDGGHVVVSMGVHGALHRSPDGLWEWVEIGDYGRRNPLSASGGDATGGGGGAPSPLTVPVALVTPFALALAAIPLARTARRNGRRGSSGALPAVFGGLALLAVSPVVVVARAVDARGLEITAAVLIVAAAVVVVAVTRAVVGRPRAGAESAAAGRPLPPPVAPAPPRPPPLGAAGESGPDWLLPPP